MRRSRFLASASEFQEQCAVIQWWALACRGYGLPEFSLLAVPNGAHLAGDARGRAIKMVNLKRAGLRPGVPDLFLACPCLGVVGEDGEENVIAHGLWIEMKRRPNKPSPEQAAILLYLRQRGYHCVIAWSADEAIKAIKAYLASSAPQQLTPRAAAEYQQECREVAEYYGRRR